MLAGLAMKRNMQLKKGNKPFTPNLITGINTQICWEKFCNYWDVEMRQVPLEKGRYIIDPVEAVKFCDEIAEPAGADAESRFISLLICLFSSSSNSPSEMGCK